MKPAQVSEVRDVLARATIGTKIVVNGYGPWEIIDKGQSTKHNGDYIDTWWHCVNEDGVYKRLFANDSGLRMRATKRDMTVGPGYYTSDENMNQCGGGNRIHRINIIDGDSRKQIVSDTVASDIIDEVKY